jgi:hypothetical protein
MSKGRELLPRETIEDLLGSDEFPAEIADTEGAAKLIIQRLIDAGFVILSYDDPRLHREEDGQ